MKKIMIVMPQLFGGGAERVAASLAEEFSKKEGFEVHVVTYIRNQEKDYTISNQVFWHTLNENRRFVLARIWNKILFLKNTIHNVEPDCVISLAGPAMITLLTVAMLGTDIPLILSERNDPQKYPRSYFLRFLRNWAYTKSSAIVFQTHEAMDFFPPHIQRKGTVISNPLTPHLPDPYFGQREPKIVTCCRLTPQKNVALLIDSFSDIAEEFPQYTLEIFGDGPDREYLNKKIQSLHLERKITLHGYSNSIYKDIQRAAMFVLSSDYEGISNSMLEAIALGIPTICTDCPAGGARETISHGKNGLLVPVGDRAKLADAMRILIFNPEFANRLGNAGVELREKISISAIAAQWLTVIESAIIKFKQNS